MIINQDAPDWTGMSLYECLIGGTVRALREDCLGGQCFVSPGSWEVILNQLISMNRPCMFIRGSEPHLEVAVAGHTVRVFARKGMSDRALEFTDG